MDFPTPLMKARLVKRYKRFLSDHALPSGEVVTAHVANSGSMIGLTEPGMETWLSPAANPERKLRFTWELVRAGEALVGINTSHPNALVAEAILGGQIPELAGYASLKREVAYGTNSRVDIVLARPGAPDCYVEVKNVHLSRTRRWAEFPDSITARGAKHLEELARVVAGGGRAAMMYLVQRADCDGFRLAADIDPTYAEGLARARARGVETLCYSCNLSSRAIHVDRPLPLHL